MSNDNPEKPSDIARNIWLAGLGAYGKAIRDAQGKLEEAAKEPPRLFRELVEKGSRLEDEVRDSLSTIRKSSSMSVEDRINRVRDSFHLNLGRSDDIEAINARLDALEEKIDALTAAVSGKPKRKAPARRKTPAAKKTPAGRKPPAKKKVPTGKKAPVKKKAPTKAKAPARKKATAARKAR